MARGPDAIKEAAEAARTRTPVSADPQFAALRDAKAGRPALVHTPQGRPAFWLVPLVTGEAACGFVRVELTGRVVQVGTFGAGPADRASWVERGFFERPPPRMVAEVHARYHEHSLSAPMLSYDASPARWAWRIEVKRRTGDVRSGPSPTGGATVTVVFMSPGGWHERPFRGAGCVSPPDTDIEG